jgi:hypothetical protein
MTVTFTAAGSPDDLDVNMSNRNAALVCQTLGIELDPDWCGEMPALDFQGRVLMALAVAPTDEGMPSYEHVGPGARMIEGARRAGYTQERLGQLHDLAVWAARRDVAVWWS